MQEHDATHLLEEASEEFIGRWNRLVSTTNWDKGRIIHEWRTALIASGAATTEYSDEAWSRMVGGVTGQHAGRLRRVYERFGDVYDQYAGLFWSHFQSTLDWDDAEMWLEGSVQNRWSVAEMRRRRWETMGAVEADKPRDSDVVSSEVDEDYSADESSTTSSADASSSNAEDSDRLVADDYMSEARSPAGPDFGDEDDVPADSGARDSLHDASDVATTTTQLVRPLADLPELPEDLGAAFEAFQLAILRHKGNEWSEISCDDVLVCLDALKALAVAPSDE